MTTPETKLFLSLQINDLERYPVWESVPDRQLDATVFPVTELPVSRLADRVVGTRVRLANGQDVWAILLYLDAKDAWKNEHLARLRVERNGHWFDLARYWDLDFSRNGPEALASFLGLSEDEVFPISYDVSKYVEGDPSALVGSFLKEPRQRLPEAEIIRLAVP
jgi:hypothetical protein